MVTECLNDMGLETTVSDLTRPQPQKIQRIYEHLVEVAMNVNRDVVAPAMKAASEDIGGQFSEIYPADTLDLLGLFVNLQKLFYVVRAP